MQIDIINDAIKEELQLADDTDGFLFLEQHKEYPTHFSVNSYDPFYIHKLKDMVDQYRAVPVFKFGYFVDRAKEEGYNRIVFLKDPKTLFHQIEHIHDPLPIELNKELFPFQLEGFNFSKDQDATIFVWSTGVGKSVVASAKAKYLLENDLVDKIVVASKNHNKHNWKKQLLETADLESEVVESPGKDAAIKRERRTEIYNNAQIFIVNYEKFRFRDLKNPQTGGDGQEILAALKGKRVFFIWDEGPSKLGNMRTITYKGVKQIMKVTKHKQIWLSATPIENSPENIYSFVKLIDPSIFDTLSSFKNRYAASFSPFSKFEVAMWDMQKLPEIGLKLAHITHRADRFNDPEIRSQFPEKHIEDIDIDWSSADRWLYDAVTTTMAEKFLAEKGDYDSLLARIGILQHICNNPLALKLAKGDLAEFIQKNYTLSDKWCAKLEVLHELIEETEGKIIIYSAFNLLGSQMLAKYMEKWKYPYVLYTGKQDQEDLFRFHDGPAGIKVFISSDLGSDSLNLREAQTVINYDLPWKFTTHHQREGRHDRIDSMFDNVFVYNLLMADSIEIRKKMIIGRKEAYQNLVFSGAIADQSESLGMTKQDLYFILTGQQLDY